MIPRSFNCRHISFVKGPNARPEAAHWRSTSTFTTRYLKKQTEPEVTRPARIGDKVRVHYRCEIVGGIVGALVIGLFLFCFCPCSPLACLRMRSFFAMQSNLAVLCPLGLCRIRSAAGELIDTSDDSEPLEFIIGEGEV